MSVINLQQNIKEERITKTVEPLKICLLAVGGDGGGVLTQWIVKMAEEKNYWAQSTSIAGVAQRTGATVYYIELIPKELITVNGEVKTPVLAQMPAPFDVDIVLATELMEAGRAIQRNFVSQKTTMIFSTHRNLAIKEKETPGDGIANGQAIVDMVSKYSKKGLYGNLKILAEKNKSVISASMFGALAASQVMSGFTKADFIRTIQAGEKGIQNSVNAFEESYNYITDFIKTPTPYKPSISSASFQSMPKTHLSKQMQELLDDIRKKFPSITHDVIYYGVTHLIDWQNIGYAKTYVEKLKQILAVDRVEKEFELTINVAKYLATAMSYDDLVFVADQKTRQERTKEVYSQVNATEKEIVKTLDYLHPGFHEVVGFFPASIGKKLASNEAFKNFFNKYLDSDRRMYSSKLFNFIMLYGIGGMRGWRLKTLRHHDEMENCTLWMERIFITGKHNYDLAVQITKTYRVKKGYGDTYAKGQSKFTLLNDYAMIHQDDHDVSEKINYLLSIALQHHDLQILKNKINELYI